MHMWGPMASSAVRPRSVLAGSRALPGPQRHGQEPGRQTGVDRSLQDWLSLQRPQPAPEPGALECACPEWPLPGSREVLERELWVEDSKQAQRQLSGCPGETHISL